MWAPEEAFFRTPYQSELGTGQAQNNKNMTRFINYIRDTRGELRHVAWPTRRQAIIYTIIVIVISVVTSAYLGFFDYLFSLILQKFVL